VFVNKTAATVPPLARTGLSGYFDREFDFTIEFGPPPPPPGAPDPFDRQSFPLIFTVYLDTQKYASRQRASTRCGSAGICNIG